MPVKHGCVRLDVGVGARERLHACLRGVCVCVCVKQETFVSLRSKTFDFNEMCVSSKCQALEEHFNY